MGLAATLQESLIVQEASPMTDCHQGLMLWTQKDTSGMEIRALGFSPQTSNWCHFWLILYFSLPSEGLLLFISSFQSNSLRDFTILFTYGYSAWGSPQLSCFSDICTALSNSIPDLQEK